jgi:hypothetical protein
VAKGVFGGMALLLGLLFAVVVAWLVWRQALEVHAPRDPGVCWRRGADGRFVILSRDLTGIEACAGDLERIHMRTGESLVGAYQGRFIFVDTESIRSADRLDGVPWRLYFDNQRRALDKDLNAHDITMTTKR